MPRQGLIAVLAVWALACAETGSRPAVAPPAPTITLSIVGTNDLPDVYEQPRQMLDLSLRFPVTGGVAARVDAKNLFDSEAIVKQGDVVREAYRSGRVFSIGLSWRPGAP